MRLGDQEGIVKSTLPRTAKLIFKQLSEVERQKYLVSVLLLGILSIADVFGLFLLSILITEIAGSAVLSELVSRIDIVNPNVWIRLSEFQIEELCLVVTLFYILKSMLHYFAQKWLHRILVGSSQRIGSEVSIRTFLELPMLPVYLNSREFIRYVNFLIPSVLTGGLTSIAILIADSIAISALLIAVSLISPFVVFFLVTYFSLVALLLRIVVGKNSTIASSKMLESELQTEDKLSFLFSALRFLNGQHGIKQILSETIKVRMDGYSATGKFMFNLLLPKYILETALIFGILLLIVFSNLLNITNSESLTYVSLFIVTASKLVPNALRIQFYSTMLRKISIEFQLYLEQIEKGRIINDFFNQTKKRSNESLLDSSRVQVSSKGFIHVSNLNFQHPGRNFKTLSNVNCVIDKGDHVGIMGLNGSGKSTLLDIVSGLLPPESGSVSIDGLPPREYVARNPKKLSYVAQESSIKQGSIYQNVALGAQESEIDREFVKFLLKGVNLEDNLIVSLLNENVILREMGKNLSGGQKQKIGIARALYFRPKILLLDEATSAMDAGSESAVVEFILKNFPSLTMLSVSHKRNAIKKCSKFMVIAPDLVSEYLTLESCLNSNVDLKIE